MFNPENTCTPARLEALFKLSVVTILRHSYRSLQHFCGLWVLSPTRHLVRHILYLVRDLVGISLLAVCTVAIHLVHANANLFLSRKIDQCRMLSRLSLDFTELFATAGYTLYFVVSCVVSISNCRRSACQASKELVDPNEGGCVSACDVGDLLGGALHHSCLLKAIDLEVFIMMRAAVT